MAFFEGEWGKRILGPLGLLGVAAAIGTLVLQTNGTLSNVGVTVVVVSIITLFLALGVLILIQGLRANRERVAGRVELANRLGLSLTENPDRELQAKLLGTLGHIPQVRTFKDRLGWFMEGELHGERVFACQHARVRPHGDSITIIQEVIVGVDCPSEWLDVAVTRSVTPAFDSVGVFRRLRRAAMGKRNIELESEDFNRAWDVKCESAEFALCLLTPEVQQLVTTSGAERWDIGRSVITCVMPDISEQATIQSLHLPIAFKRAAILSLPSVAR